MDTIEFHQLSERVKAVDFHPLQPWILTSLYSGNVCIWNHRSQSMEKSFKVSDSQVRAARFIPAKNWVICGSDDKFIRVYNYYTSEKVNEFEAHDDFIRCIVIHPVFPYVLSTSDDKLIKLWNWEKDWECTQTFEGHAHYVMGAAFNPDDQQNSFASVSLDDTIKIWALNSYAAKITWDAHSKGINCLDYFVTNDKTYLITGSDDYTAKVWDLESENCIQVLEAHTNNITTICTHPELPIIITASEDGTIRIWNATSYRLENTLNYDLGRVWCTGYNKGSDLIAFGCDKGTVVIKVRGTFPLEEGRKT